MGRRDASSARDAALRREQQGDTDAAVALYREAGLPQEGARLLASNGRHAEAGGLLLQGLGVEPSRVGGLDSARRKLAHVAAIYLAKGGEVAQAVELLVALGEPARAADLLEQSGDYVKAERLRSGAGGAVSGRRAGATGDEGGEQAARRAEREGRTELAIQLYAKAGAYREAGRLLAQQGKMAEAAQAFVAAGQPYEAGACYLHAGDDAAGLAQLLKVPADDPRYRKAAVQVVRCCHKGADLDFSVEHYLAGLVSSDPQDKVELEAFYVLAGLYERQGMTDGAADLLRRVLERAGGSYRDAADRLARLTQAGAARSEIRQQISAEEAAFRGARKAGSPGASLTSGGRVKLADLPGLPPLRDPSLQQGAAGPAAQQAPLAAEPEGMQLNPAGATIGLASPSGSSDRHLPAPGPGGSGSFQPAPADSVSPEPVAQPAPVEQVFAIGATVAARYQLQAQIGEGGMAQVFRALDTELDEEIAIKVFLQQTVDPRLQEQSLARFKEELKLSRRLNHQNIIRLYDIGMVHGLRYITMELLNGQTLEELLTAGGIDYGQGLSYLIQACAGLQVAHDKGVVHRDIKPDNLFVTDEQLVKVLDFGIAKTAEVTGRTVQGMVAGTPEYMAPEQISDFSSVSPATDIYALGVIAFRMFTGRVPFADPSLTKLLMMHVSKEPPSPRSVCEQVPEDLELLILSTLAKAPEQRPGSCRELAAYLEAIRARFQ